MNQSAIPVNTGNGTPAPRRAFTLVELLVVITIIGILAGLVLVAANAARQAAEQARIRAELTGLDGAMLQYGNDISGGSYPPNLMTGSLAQGTLQDSHRASILANLKRHFNAAFPKHREPDELFERLCGCRANGRPHLDGLPGGLAPQEALVFWLGGFSDDPKYPVSGPGGPSYIEGSQTGEDWASRKRIFEFDTNRLGPRNSQNNFDDAVGRQFRYRVNMGNGVQTRTINMWQYYPHTRQDAKSYAYFDTSRDPLDTLTNLSKFPAVLAIKQRKNTVTDPNSLRVGDIRYANEGKCQILSAGLDDEWGPFVATQGVNYTLEKSSSLQQPLLLYPNGPFAGDLGDTITNFSSSATLEASQP